jgi:hypothetical protein
MGADEGGLLPQLPGGRSKVIHIYRHPCLKGFLRKSAPALLILTICGGVAMSPRKSSDTGRVRVLFIGQPMGGDAANRNYAYLESDPFIDPTPVIAWSYYWPDEVIRKSVRMYMPRNYENLIEGYDVISLQYADMEKLCDYAKWFSDAIGKDGLGLYLMGVGWSYANWFDTTVADVLPVDLVRIPETALSYRRMVVGVRILKPEHPLISSVPWSKAGQYGHFPIYNVVSPRDGSEVLANVVPFLEQESPFLVWWDIGKGRTLTQTSSYDDVDALFTEWDFYPDWDSNIHLFSAGQDIPQNPYLVHKLRSALWDCRVQRGGVISLIDFVSELGGNPLDIEKSLTNADDKIKEAETMYLSQEFEKGLVLTNEALLDLEKADDEAMKLKDRTFIWIYTIEWLILMATSMGAGTMVWGFMIRRYFFREVITTRLSRIAT